jgi:hypothetical protein
MVIGDRLRELRKEILEIVCLYLAINFSGDAFRSSLAWVFRKPFHRSQSAGTPE